jgi:hypothetical protein
MQIGIIVFNLLICILDDKFDILKLKKRVIIYLVDNLLFLPFIISLKQDSGLFLIDLDEFF